MNFQLAMKAASTGAAPLSGLVMTILKSAAAHRESCAVSRGRTSGTDGSES